jgi:hypothetical protein
MLRLKIRVYDIHRQSKEYPMLFPRRPSRERPGYMQKAEIYAAENEDDAQSLNLLPNKERNLCITLTLAEAIRNWL